MQPDRWREVSERIKAAFPTAEFSVDQLIEPQVGTIEAIEFSGPLGRMRLEYTTRPVVIDKITHGSRRIGSQAMVEYVYSPDEFSYKFNAYRWSDTQNDWQEIEATNFNI